MSDVRTSRLLTTDCLDDCEDDQGDHQLDVQLINDCAPHIYTLCISMVYFTGDRGGHKT